MLTKNEETALEVCRVSLAKLNLGADRPYLASAALAYFLGGPPNYHIMRAEDAGNKFYWVQSRFGTVIDPNDGQFNGSRPVYSAGKKVQKQNNSGNKSILLLEEMRRMSPSGGGRPVDLFGRQTVLATAEPLTDAQRNKLDDAWRVVAAEWSSRPDEFLRCHFTKGAMAVYFVRAILYGEPIPRTATLAYTPDRYYVAGHAFPLSTLLPRAIEDPRALKSLKFAVDEDPDFSTVVARNLPVMGHRIPTDFPISLARELIDKYCPPGGRMLDPCHGWGGRMVGFMLSKASSYVGVDPAPHSPKLQEMFDDLRVYLFEPKRVRLINKPFEDVGLGELFYDFALTSPPYYNIEKYQGEESSWRRYKTLDAWMAGFYRELIAGVADALKPGAYFVLQTTTKFKMTEAAKEIGASVGLEYIRTHDTAMRRYNSAAPKEGASDLFEVFTVFRKR